MGLPSKKALIAAAGTLLAAAGALAVGAAVGRSLLDSMNDADAPVLAVVTAHADVEGGAGVSGGAEPYRLVVAVLDGLGEAGCSEALRAVGVDDWQWRASVDMGTPSLSRPVYHVLLTGVPQAVSGIGNNTHSGRARADDLAARVRAAGGTVGWALEGVPWFHDLFGRPEDVYENAWSQRGAVVTDRFGPMADVLRRGPTFAVLHFVGIDHAGHSHGAASEEYRREAAQAMGAAVRLREAHAASAAGARTVWMIGSDHGHRARGGHGGPESEVVRTTWLGWWPEVDGAGGADGTGRVEIPGVVAADRLAATFAAILGVAPPRTALGEPLPLPDRTVMASPARAARRAAVNESLAVSESGAHRGALLRGGLVLAAVVVILALVGRRRVAVAGAAVLPVLGAGAAFWALGPGWTLSAIASKEGFLVQSTGVMALGAALGSWIARRWRAPLGWVFAASGFLPAAAYVIAAGSMGRSRLSDTALLLFPTTGLVPWSVVAGATAVSAVAAIVDRRRSWRAPRVASDP